MHQPIEESWYASLPTDPSKLPTLEEVERVYIAHVLRVSEGNKSLTARILGCDRRTLYRKLSPRSPAT